MLNIFKISYTTIFIVFLFTNSIICIIIVVLSFVLIEKTPNKEKTSIYECGFNPIKKTGRAFSISFFKLAIIFLIFDLEILLLLPYLINISINISFINFIIYIFINIIILGGLIFEWKNGGLEWEK